MSDFLINLARRGAGLPAGSSIGRPPVRDNQALSENFELEQIVETSEPPAFEPQSQLTSETTPARRAPTSPMSQVQGLQEPRPARVPPAPGMITAPETAPAAASPIQRSPEASSHIANPLSENRSESPARSVGDQNYASEVRVNSPTVVRPFPQSINERASTSSGPARPLSENVLVATPRFSTNEQPPMIESPGSQEPARAILSDADKALQIVSVTETDEPSKGERQRERRRERDRLGVVLTPRSPAIDQRLTRPADVVPAAAADVASMPVHVRIAKVEVRAAPATVPPPAVQVGPAPIGFESYYRLRTYRS